MTDHYDIPYNPDKHPKHHLDIFCPRTKEGKDDKTPVVVFVHGGGWKRGDRKYKTLINPHLHKNVGIALRNHGFTVVVVSYRLAAISKRMATVVSLLLSIALSLLFFLVLSILEYFVDLGKVSTLMYFPLVFMILFGIVLFLFMRSREGHTDNQHPTQVQDVAQAYKWVTQNIANYGGDPHNIVMMGHSAGAHITLLLSLDEKYLQQINVSTMPSAVIGISGVYNFGRLKKSGKFSEYFYVRPLLGNSDKDALIAASPLTYAKKTPFPIVLMHGSSHELHLPKDAKELFEKLVERGAQVELRIVPGTHITIISQMGKDNDLVTPILAEVIKEKTAKNKQH